MFTFNTSAVEDVTTSVGKGPEVLDNGLTVSTMIGATLKSIGVDDRSGARDDRSCSTATR